MIKSNEETHTNVSKIDESFDLLKRHDINTTEGLNAVLFECSKNLQERIKNGHIPKASNKEEVFAKLEQIRQRKKELEEHTKIEN